MSWSEEELLSYRDRGGAVRQVYLCNLVHGSGHNMSPLPRKVFIAAYNSVDNRPRPVENPRPDWVVSRRYDPVR